MLKVVIVDDELLMRKGLQSLIDWGQQGFTVVGEAADGEEALTVIRAEQPDVVFTDIIMPQMGGLPLIREALREFPRIKFVVLSCHNDYEYVREALMLGARDYILKLSMLPDDLAAVLQKLSHEIYAEKPAVQTQGDGKHEAAEALREVLYHSETGKESVIERYFAGKQYSVVYIRLYFEAAGRGDRQSGNVGQSSGGDRQSGSVGQSSGGDRQSGNVGQSSGGGGQRADGVSRTTAGRGKGQAVANFLANNFFREQDVLIKRDDTTILVLTTVDYEQLRDACDRYAAVLLSQFGLFLMGGMSREKSPQTFLKRLYDQARDACGQGFYEGYGIYSYRSGYFSHALAGPRAAAIIIEAGGFLAACDCEGAGLVLQKLWAEMADSRLDPEEALVICFEIYLKYQRVLYDKIGGGNVLLKKSGFQDSIKALGTFSEIQAYLLSIARNLVGNLELFQAKVLKDEVSRVIAYIGDRLGEELSLGSAAAHVSLSESYLSHLFKKEIGESFSDYLQKRRVEKAKQLLAGTADSATVVAAECGYEDYSYFCRVFKKGTGMTPREYRRSQSQRH